MTSKMKYFTLYILKKRTEILKHLNCTYQDTFQFYQEGRQWRAMRQSLKKTFHHLSMLSNLQQYGSL